ncbi:FGFR1 oncogene partner, partial [Asbolus verrucosus]
MSVEEEVELRDLVAQTLELNGCLPKIRAQLRANLFLALDEDAKISKQQPLINNKIRSHLEMPEGQLMFCLVREFLEYFDLDFTISVYEPESYVGSCYKYEGRQKIIEDLGLKAAEENFSGPVLLELVRIAQTKSKTLKINLTNINGDKVGEQKESNSSSSLFSSHNEINGHSSQSQIKENSVNNKNDEEQRHFNKTYALKKSTPSNYVEKSIKENVEVGAALIEAPLDSTYTKKEADDDTFNGTSSIEEETVNGTDSVDQKSTAEEENVTSSSPSQDTSPDSKSKSEDKITPQKCDKRKPKLELSPLNKSLGSDLLPSLYTKDFKEKNNKDLDLDFDIKDDYEEDFMSGSEMEFSL